MADIYIGNVKGPQGDTGATGPQGAAGDAATVQVGTVSTTAYGNPAQVVNSGTEHAAILNFTIPQGAPGATVTQLDNLALNTITTSTDQYPQIQVGDLGRVIFGKIIKFFQDLVSALAEKINYSDALTMEEIEAASDLTDKVSAAAASKNLKESLSNSYVTRVQVWSGTASFGTSKTISHVDLQNYKILEVYLYVGSVGSSNRRVIFIDRTDIDLAVYYPTIAAGASGFAWFRPIEYTNNQFTYQASESMGVYSIFGLK